MVAKGNTRKTGLEQYYTPDDLAQTLTQLVLDSTDAMVSDDWLEPAAGTGSFTRAITGVGVPRVKITQMDIEPKRASIVEQDFLTSDLSLSDAVCVTNPPFGRNHSLSIPFFNKAAESCRIIGFVVPRSWRKWSIVNRLDPRFHKVVDVDLEISYVDEVGAALSKSSVLRTVFQVWERREDLRSRFPAVKTTHFDVVKPEEANGSLTIFGRGCGTLKTEFPAKPNTTQMFIKASPETLRALDEVDLSAFFTQVAYTEALSVVEINFALEHWLRTGRQLEPEFLRLSTLES
jgi:predicted RNA methylase